MFDVTPTGKAISHLGPTALSTVEFLQAIDNFFVEAGEIQVMIFHDQIGQLGGISTHRRGQYILTSAVAGRISTERLESLGFHSKRRADGSLYWYRPGHKDFRALITALEEISGRLN